MFTHGAVTAEVKVATRPSPVARRPLPPRPLSLYIWLSGIVTMKNVQVLLCMLRCGADVDAARIVQFVADAANDVAADMQMLGQQVMFGADLQLNAHGGMAVRIFQTALVNALAMRLLESDQEEYYEVESALASLDEEEDAGMVVALERRIDFVVV